MPKRPDRWSPERQQKVLQAIYKQLALLGLPHPITELDRFSDYDQLMSTLEIVERLSIVFMGYPTTYIHQLGASFFPEYLFQYTPNSENLFPLLAKTANGQKSLYQAAKEVSIKYKKELIFPKGCESTLQDLVPDCSDRPYMMEVFQELLGDREKGIFGYCGFISRVALLFREDSAFLGSLNAYLSKSDFHVGILEKPDGPSPAFIFTPPSQVMEFVSKEGRLELLDRVEHHKRLWLQKLP